MTNPIIYLPRRNDEIVSIVTFHLINYIFLKLSRKLINVAVFIKK